MQKKNYLNEVKYLLGNNNKDIVYMIFMFLIVSVIELVGISLIFPYVSLIVNPQIVQENVLLEKLFFDRGYSFLETMNFLGLFLIIIFLSKSIFGIFVNREISRFSFKKSVDIRSLLMKSYQDLPYLKYTERNSSEFIHNINLADKFAGSTLAPLLKLASEGIVILVIISFLAFHDIISLLVILFLLIPLILFYDKVFRPYLLRYGKKSNSASKSVVKNINEAIKGLKEIRVLGKERYFYHLMRESAKEYADVSVNAEVITVAPRFLMEFLIIAVLVLAIFIHTLLSGNLIEFLPTLSLFGIAGIRLSPAANQIIININKLRFSRNAVSLLYSDLRDLENIKEISSTNKLIEQNFEELKLVDVSFKYYSRNEVIFDKVNLTINKGDYIGVLGPSGSGKSTFINLLLGLLDPSTGNMILNGKQIDENDNTKFMDYVGYLPQDVFLIDDSIANNIALGIETAEVNFKKVRDCIEKAKLSELISNLPDGIETRVGENGLQLSGGQKQRVAIARLLYFEKEVIIMDESTSSLDTLTEKEIINEVNAFKNEKTIIAISHRVSTLSNCDKYFKIIDGKIKIEDNIT